FAATNVACMVEIPTVLGNAPLVSAALSQGPRTQQRQSQLNAADEVYQTCIERSKLQVPSPSPACWHGSSHPRPGPVSPPSQRVHGYRPASLATFLAGPDPLFFPMGACLSQAAQPAPAI